MKIKRVTVQGVSFNIAIMASEESAVALAKACGQFGSARRYGRGWAVVPTLMPWEAV